MNKLTDANGGANTNKSKVNKLITKNYPSEEGRKTKLVILDFGFRTDLSCGVSIAEAEASDDAYIDDVSRDTANAVTDKITALAGQLSLMMSNFEDESLLVKDDEYVKTYEQLTTLVNAQWHGTSCHFIAQADSRYSDHFPGCFDFAPHVDVKLLHLDPLEGPIDRSPVVRFGEPELSRPFIERDKEQAFELTPALSLGEVVSGLNRLIEYCAHGNVLSEGDVIVLPLQLEMPEGVRPLHTEPEIERLFQILTNIHGVIVVTAAGNDFLQNSLGTGVSPDQADWTPSFLINSGTACGAIVVAEDRIPAHLTDRRGYRWIDAFLDLLPEKINLDDVEDEELKTDLQNLDLAIRGHDGSPKTSASSVAVACLVATVQEARRRRDLVPLKPYEARAHLRQWRNEVEGKRHAPPNILAWLIGTQVFRIGPDHAIYGNDYEIEKSEVDGLLYP